MKEAEVIQFPSRNQPREVGRIVKGDLILNGETRAPFVLMCEHDCKRPTKHKFVGKRVVATPTGYVLHHEIVYRCGTCLCDRLYGIEGEGIEA